MIIGEQRETVITNIAAAAAAGTFHEKVEINDPVLTAQQEQAIVSNYLAHRGSSAYQRKTRVARTLVNIGTALVNRNTQIIGLEKLDALQGGAILTCNHFSPLDNTVIRHLTHKLGKKRINIISQVSNFAMPGMIGFIMNYADTIPLGEDPRYLLRQLPDIISELTEQGEFVLIYPEQEMWFNYRKPRPPKRGAYHFAARLGRPIISCFVEMRDLPEHENDEFSKVRYTLHILGTIKPDPAKSVNENSREMCALDCELKRAAYERIYGEPLDYEFESTDIAGWIIKDE